MATAEGKAGSDTDAPDCSSSVVSCGERPSVASSVLSGSIAPRPSDTWSAWDSPMDGRVTVPTMVSVLRYRPVPTVTVPPTCLPSWRRVMVPSSICSGPLIGWPLVVGGCTEP